LVHVGALGRRARPHVRRPLACCVATGEEAVALGESRGEDGIVSFAAAGLAYARLAQGDWHGAIAYAELGLASAPTIYFQGFSQAHLAAAFCHTARADQSVPVLEAISGLLKASEHQPGWMHVTSLLAEGQLERSDVDAAATTAEEVADVSGRAHARYYVSPSQRLLAEVALIRGDLSKAEQHVENSLSVARQLGAENALALAQVVRGRLKLRRGETGSAQLDLQESLEVFERLGTVGFPRHIREHVAAVRS
jgi:tetratricopeptide (TPR) repeat protein